MRQLVLSLSILCLAPPSIGAQLSDAALTETIRTAESTPTAENLIGAAAAARLMRDYDAAEEHLDAAWEAVQPNFNGLINNSMMLAVASGEGVGGMQRTFRELNERFNFTPIQISNWAGTYPEILWDGEYDEMLMRFSPESTDPMYRCECYSTIAWSHRLAGRHDEASASWALVVRGESPALTNAISEGNADAEATLRGQYARDLVRAGRNDEARRQLERSMSISVSAAGLPTAQRRWAQAAAELGDAAGAVAHLEPLLEANSLISVNTLRTRAAWMLIRDDPAFQALLERHR
jgi:tetratricopeptide (TPR) repeat protein